MNSSDVDKTDIPKSESNPQLLKHLEKASNQWSQYVSFNTSSAVSIIDLVSSLDVSLK